MDIETSVEDRAAAHFMPPGESQDADVSEDVEQELSQSEEVEQPEADEAEESTPEQETSAQFEEVEFQGKKYQVPPELKDALMAQSDYTAKTTETARLKETLTLQQQEVALFQEQRAFEQSVSEEVEQLKMLDAYIQHSKSNTDWSTLSTDEIVRARLEIDQLGEQRNELKQTIDGKRDEFTKMLEGERGKLRESSNEVLSKAIPNWNDEVKGEVEKSLLNRGYPEIAMQNMTALDYQVAWEAEQYRKLKAGKDAALQTASQAPPAIRPGASNPMPQDVKQKLQFKKQLDKARKDHAPEAQTAKILQQRLEQKLRRIS